ncbi:unnamed protein product, partial [Phaeothamnion confervicola]
MLDMLQTLMDKHGYFTSRLDGSVNSKERQVIINDFTRDPTKFVFLMSTKACGLGINLQSASRVIIYDVNWNPSFDQQAQDRAYRQGCRLSFSALGGLGAIFRLVSVGTMEEMTYMRQIYKVQLGAAALDPEGQGGRRQFRAIQGVKGKEGELFGMHNLLRLEATAAAAAMGSDGRGDGLQMAAVNDLTSAIEQGVKDAARALGRRRRRQRDTGGGGGGGDAGCGGISSGGGDGGDGDDGAGEDIDECKSLLELLGIDAFAHDDMVAKDERDEGSGSESEEESDGGGGGGGSSSDGDGSGGGSLLAGYGYE